MLNFRWVYDKIKNVKRSRFIVIRGLHVPPTRLPSAAPTSERTAAKPSCSRTAVVINHQASGCWFRNVANQLRLVVYHPILYRVWDTSKRWLFGISEASTVLFQPPPCRNPSLFVWSHQGWIFSNLDSLGPVISTHQFSDHTETWIEDD